MLKTIASGHYVHFHDLFLVENTSDVEKDADCYVCGELVSKMEAAYVCQYMTTCYYKPIIHKKCGELPSEIRHPKHPQHLLTVINCYYKWCDICLHDITGVCGYRCSLCDFYIDLNCGKLIGMEKQLSHPGHPDHPLTLTRKPALPFCCDGCGDHDVDMAYICSICDFWVHEKCALLPLVLPTNPAYHHHDLSLVFSSPAEHSQYMKYCDVCGKRLKKAYWAYLCGDCRFYAHLKCATTQGGFNIFRDQDDKNGSDAIQFPIEAKDISLKLITPFVMRGNEILDMPTTIKMPETSAAYSFSFNYHKHPLTLVSESHEDHSKIIDEEDEDEDEDEEDATSDKLKICDVCITPISSPPYYACVACKYFVHSICYSLPKTIPLSSWSSSSFSDFSQLHGPCAETQNGIHKFTLYTSSESKDIGSLPRCAHCYVFTNGRVYECEGCDMTIDVKCASLPTTIKHSSHKHHRPLTVTRRTRQKGERRWKFQCCEDDFFEVAYCCSSDECDYAVHLTCAMLPPSVKVREWDKHPLLLTFDASRDHPSGFICGFCEGKMHPKQWMYHCRHCDNSFDLDCLRAASGDFRNIKFGRQFVFDGIHPHPLTFNCVTIKKRCDICREDWFNYRGLECAQCNYLMCEGCAREKLASPSSSSQ